MSQPPAPPPSRKKAAVSLSSQVSATGRAEGAVGRKRSRSEVDNVRMLDSHPSSTPTRIAVAEESTDRHAGMTPNNGSDGATPRPQPPPHEKVRAASVMLANAQSAVNKANAEVLELEVTQIALRCKKFQRSLEDDLKYHFRQFVEIDPIVQTKLATTAQSVYNSVSKVEAKEELEKTEAKLKAAENKLEAAEKKLEKTKAEVRELKVPLEKAKTGLLVTELADRVKTALSGGQLCIASLVLEVIGEAQGMAELAKELVGRLNHIDIKELLDGSKIQELQRTVAFVLTCSSGVGKTFFSLAVAQLLSKLLDGRKVGTLYLGFNSVAPLQDDEEKLLRRAPTYQSVELVLLRRLLIQLQYLQALPVSFTDEYGVHHTVEMNGKPVPFTFDKYGVQHTVSMDDVWLRDLPLLDCELAAASDEALKLLKAVQVKYELSHLMLVIDEGQKLDKLIPPGPDQEGGARCALRWTRVLQFTACKRKCGLLCFGLMTGINPKTSLKHATEGTNHPLRHMPMTRDDFKKLTKEALEKKTNCPELTDQEIHLVAAAVFPDARILSSFKFDSSGDIVFPAKAEFFTLEIQEDVARAVVVGALTNIGVHDDGDWAQSVPSKYLSSLYRIPCPSYAMTVALLNSRISSLQLLEPCIKNFFQFEEFGATVLRLLIMIRTAFSVSSSMFSKESESIVLDHVFPHPEVRGKMETAFPTTMKECDAVKAPFDALQKYYPSSKHGSHDAAFAVDDALNKARNTSQQKKSKKPSEEKPPELAERFKLHTSRLNAADLTKPDSKNTMLFHCGGSAPMDFVILHKTSGSEWQLTLADAKHTSNDSAREGEEMALKGDMVFRFLEHQLKEVYRVTLTWDRTVLLLTNAKHDDPVREVQPRPQMGKPLPNPVTIVRLMPSTFKLGCVTEYLFALPYGNTDAADAPTEKKKVKVTKQ